MGNGPKLQTLGADGFKLPETIKVEASDLTGSVRYLFKYVSQQLDLSGEQRALIEPGFTRLDRTLLDKAEEWKEIFVRIVDELRLKGVQLEQQEALLTRMRRDGRTLLGRREVGEEELVRSVREEHRGSGFGIELVDHDRFKFYNDSYGHEVGDLILSTTGRIFRMHREGDIGIRWGGDEFLRIVLKLTTHSQLSLIASRDIELVRSHPWVMLDERFKENPPRLSIGLVYCEIPSEEERKRMKEVDAAIVVAPEQQFDPLFPVPFGSSYDVARKLVAKADSNMYESKREGKGPVQTNVRVVNGGLVEFS